MSFESHDNYIKQEVKQLHIQVCGIFLGGWGGVIPNPLSYNIGRKCKKIANTMA